MRFLEDHELPAHEQERRKPIRAAIAGIQERIAAEWKHAAPELERLIRKGDYGGESLYRMEIDRRTEMLRREAIYLMGMLPPYLMLREDGILERVPILDGQSRRAEDVAKD